MNRYPFILFDLDGTLSDPKEGITKSIQYALEKMGVEVPEVHELECFIGPPLQVSFAENCGFSERETQRAIDFYRERFKEKGMFENQLYSKIPLLLKTLKDKGHTLVVATSKPTIFAEQILSYFNIAQFFDLIAGSNLDGTRTSKTEIIQYILDIYHEYESDNFIMIGDRKHDIIGAQNTGIDSIGVTYGYGSIEEISESNPTYVVQNVEGMKEVLVGCQIS
ncbi:HAD family hydrolase [Rossellomorea vietnamensis]|uniref:HAD family hydrolase n=1 Tax=Rossellomorea vietnamensis TaxID=218284 RepID=UPI00077C2125|nr:HAD family hydrolase [Rossellomorea vietnamensis]